MRCSTARRISISRTLGRRWPCGNTPRLPPHTSSGRAWAHKLADEILRALQHASGEGMTRTAIRDLFGRHQSANRIGAALALLASRGRAEMKIRHSGGRPVETWIAMEARRHG